MSQMIYSPPWALQNGLALTLYTALRVSRYWEKLTPEPEPVYQSHIFRGAQAVPIFGLVAIPENPKGTIIATYGITGRLEDQWFLRILGRKAYAQGYAVVLFDWRAHGKTAELSPTLTSDGLYEGEDFIRIADQAKAMGCPAPFWLTAYSLGGQLVLWAVKAAQTMAEWGTDLTLSKAEIGGAAAICPSLDSNRSLTYLERHPWGRYLERAIAQQLKLLALMIHQRHSNAIDLAAIERVSSIRTFDHELVIQKLGFASVDAYYNATSPLHQLPHLNYPTLILYAADDPMFDPTLVPELQEICDKNPAIDLILTAHGGHVSYLSSQACQRQSKDTDPWWAWNRVLDWFNQQSITWKKHMEQTQKC